jgi:hypothetical protein
MAKLINEKIFYKKIIMAKLNINEIIMEKIFM